MKILLLLFSLKTALCDCSPEVKKSGFIKGKSYYKVTRLGRLPGVVNESSGLAIADENRTLWTNNDSGPTVVYKVGRSGNMLDSLVLQGVQNNDWEDLAQDKQGNLYIGDTGNNLNRRKNLVIYKVHPEKPQNIGKIVYRYADQQAFPPAAEARNFDCEALFAYQNQLYLFSKNRGNNQVKMYVLPAKTGEYTAKVEGEIFLKSQVTAADINPGKTMFALLSYGKIFLFNITDKGALLENPYLCIKVARGQAEALAFINETDFIITNEKGKIFLVELKQ